MMSEEELFASEEELIWSKGKISEEELFIWKSIKTWKELTSLMKRFINQEIHTPLYYGFLNVYDYETKQLCDKLAYINDRGFLTTNSQPGIYASGYNDKSKKYYTIVQRGYIVLGIPKKHKSEVLMELKKYNVYFHHHTNRQSNYSIITEDDKRKLYGEYDNLMEENQKWHSAPLTIQRANDSFLDLTKQKFKWATHSVYRDGSEIDDLLNATHVKSENNIEVITIMDLKWNNGEYIFDVLVKIAEKIQIDDMNF